MFKKNTHLLITGGTGSFGKAMLKKVINDPNISDITILSRDEKKQEDVQNEFKSKKINFVLCDIRDRENVFSSINDVDYIFHAAALKQVPNCEFFPMEAIKTNILGAANVIDAAINKHVKKIVVLSTDKAAYPINAMGCTKMLMEKIMISKSSLKSRKCSTIVCGIRYGNVLFSRGSVVPLFLRQINENKPLTITHPNMTRFLIPLSEATELVLYAMKNGNSGDLFIRNSKAAEIIDIAKACMMIMNTKVNINYIGIRSGEKMHETLATSEEVMKSENFGQYLKIPYKNTKNFDSYVTKGTRINLSKPFTSRNTVQLNVAQIVKLLESLPEIKNFKNINKYFITIPQNVGKTINDSLLMN
tara:strand:+ start:483 stop:1562 length:1080 start_codon:yes stop_codon:yes gene_type:complete